MKVYSPEQKSFFKIYLPRDNVAGLFCFHAYFKRLAQTDFSFHLLPRKGFRFLGYQEAWYDGPIHEFGFGPIFLVVIISFKGFRFLGKQF
jgi:hypothetical protein